MVMNVKEPEKMNPTEEEDFEGTTIDGLCEDLESLSL